MPAGHGAAGRQRQGQRLGLRPPAWPARDRGTLCPCFPSPCPTRELDFRTLFNPRETAGRQGRPQFLVCFSGCWWCFLAPALG